jgi:hypothetical protein
LFPAAQPFCFVGRCNLLAHKLTEVLHPSFLDVDQGRALQASFLHAFCNPSSRGRSPTWYEVEKSVTAYLRLSREENPKLNTLLRYRGPGKDGFLLREVRDVLGKMFVYTVPPLCEALQEGFRTNKSGPPEPPPLWFHFMEGEVDHLLIELVNHWRCLKCDRMAYFFR